jgi:hypothetical protein
MKGQQASGTPEKTPPEGEAAMKEMWAAAAREFESICGESLQRGEVKSLDDVLRKIESSSKASSSTDAGPDKWDKAKSVGLKSLKYLKMLVGAASQASSFVSWTIPCSELAVRPPTSSDSHPCSSGQYHRHRTMLRVRYPSGHQGL